MLVDEILFATTPTPAPLAAARPYPGASRHEMASSERSLAMTPAGAMIQANVQDVANKKI